MPEVTQGVILTGMLWYWAFAYFYYITLRCLKIYQNRKTL